MSEETRWTKGHWVVRDCPMKAAQTDRKDDGRIKLVDFNDGVYEGTLAIVQTGESEYNAHLISAAPELYSELASADSQLEMAAEAIEAGRMDEALLHCRSMTRPRRAALAKARGETS